MEKWVSFRGFEFGFRTISTGREMEEDYAGITIRNSNGFVGGCFVKPTGEYYGHYGVLETGFDDFELELFAQQVFDAEIEEWIRK